MAENFEFISEEEKSSTAYNVCVAGTTITGLAVGSFVSVPGLLAGAAAGFVLGLVICPALKEPIKKSLFSSTDTLSDRDLTHALAVVREQSGVQRKSDALFLLAVAREEYVSDPGRYNQGGIPPMSLFAAAELLLKDRAGLAS